MNLLSISDVKEMVRKGKKTALVFKWKGTEETYGCWPENLLNELNELAQKKVSSGEFGTVEQAMRHLEEITYICTEDDYNTMQENLQNKKR